MASMLFLHRPARRAVARRDGSDQLLEWAMEAAVLDLPARAELHNITCSGSSDCLAQFAVNYILDGTLFARVYRLEQI